MPRVLMLCYYYPPIIASGVTRSLAFSEHLPEFGWEPLILSVNRSKDPWVKSGSEVPDWVTIERTNEWNFAGLCDLLHAGACAAFRLFKKDLKTNYFREWLALPDTQIAWLSSAAGVKLASTCDIIYASCSPFSSALSGCMIAGRTRKPLVVDFRDAWSLNPHSPHGWLHQTAIRMMEQKVVRQADRVILNTNGAGELYKKTYPQYAQKFVVIPNGYDELTPVKPNTAPDAPFRILHLGSFYGERSPRVLLEALAELPELPIEFVQIGGSFDCADEFKNRVKMSISPAVPREEALRRMTQASLLYLKQGFEKGVSRDIAVAAKTYEYLGTGLPILAELPPGDNSDIIQKYAGKAFIINSPNKEALKRAVREAFEARNSTEPAVSHDFVRDFNRRGLTKRLADIFNELRAVSPSHQRTAFTVPKPRPEY